MATALITGGTGFVGSHVARTLIANGHRVRILHRTTSVMTALEGLDVEHAIGDVTDYDSLLAAMPGCDWVFHVAAVADYWRADVKRLYQVNVDGTRMVLEAAEKTRVKRVIFTSSGAAIGPHPDGTPSDENTVFTMPQADWPYGHSKVLAEQEVQKAVARGLAVVTVNPAVVIGPGDINQISGSLVIELARRWIPTIPAGSITLIDVRDVAAAHLAAADHGIAGERYLLGAYDITWPDFARLTAETISARPPAIAVSRHVLDPIAGLIGLLGKLGIRLPMDAAQIRLSGRKVTFDCHKAWSTFGKPQVPLQQSIRDTYDWYVAHGVIVPKKMLRR